jgi:GPH family glycoside/pentoside/hexuronide:cation symporter
MSVVAIRTAPSKGAMITKISGMIRVGCLGEHPPLNSPHYARAQTRAGRVPLSTKIFQGIGALPDTYKNFAFNTFLLFYYNQVLGIRAVLASAAIMVALVIDAIIDPIVGSYSDNLRSRLGRRHPLMYASAIPLGVFLFLVFSPPSGLSELELFAWLTTFAIAARVSMAFYLLPWSALFAEFSDDYAERTAIVTFRYLAGWIGGVAFAFCSWSFIFPSTPEFAKGQLNPAAYHLFAPVLGVLVAASALITTHFTRKEIPYLLQPAGDAVPFSLKGVLAEVLLALRNRDFMVLFITLLTASAIGGTVEALNIYMQTYFWELRGEDLRWFSLAIIGFMAAFAMMPLLQARFDKKRLVIAGLLFLLFNGVAMISLRFLHVLPHNGAPLLLPLLIANEILRIAIATVVGIMFVSMVADALDAQELNTGKRQEGVFSAALSFSVKATSGLGVLVGGVLLDYVVSFPRGADPKAVDPHLVTMLGAIAGIALPLLYLFPFSLVSRYQITREMHADIRRRLDERHRVANGVDAPQKMVQNTA